MGKGLLFWGVVMLLAVGACTSSKPVFKGGVG